MLTALAKGVGEFVQALGREGSFALGTLLGCAITALMFWMASRDNAKRQKLDFEREKELYGQLKLKDDRINKLHDEVGKLQKLIAESGKQKRS